MGHALGKWNILDTWFVFLAGQIKDRAALLWLYERRQLIYEIWFYAAAACSLFYLLYFFGAWDERPNDAFFRLTFQLLTLNLGGGRFGDLSLGAACLVLGAITPVILILAPVALFMLPLFMVGAALWVVVAFVTLIMANLAPLGVLVGGRAIFEHYVARWLMEAGQRERERAAVYAALGLDGGASRTVTGGQGGIFQHAAQHMTEEEAAAFDGWKKSSILLGRAYGRAFFTDTLKHLLMVAGTRGGKGRDLIVPNLKIYEGGAFVLDPKGENAQRTAKNRADFGDVFALDPFGVSGLPPISFNPLAKMKGDSMIADAQMLADALIIGTDPFFSNAARQLLGGVILHVVTAPDIEKRDLSEVLRCLMQKLPETLAAMTQSDHEIAGEFLANIGEWGLNTAEEEWSGVRSNAIISLEWLASPQMAAVVQDTGGTLDFSNYLIKPMTVFVCLPAPMFSKYNRWLRLVVSSALNAMTERLAPPPLPVRFVLDEVAQLGTLSSIESALTLSAGYGVQLWGIWQHVGDIERCYPSSGISGWVSSSGVRMCFAINDNKTADEFSKQAGGVFTPDQIARLSPSQMLVLLDGQNPLIVQRDAMDMVEEPHTFTGGRQEKTAA